MKLLLDENLSYRIVKNLDADFDGSIHCRKCNPMLRTDLDIWNYAKKNDLIIVTFDSDFYEWMLLKGFPPKVVWLRCGNTSSENITNLLNLKKSDIEFFVSDIETGILELR